MRRPGFALTEVVVALLISAVAITASYGALAAVLDMRERLDASAQADIAAAEVRRSIAEWLRGAYVRPGEAGMRVLSADEGSLPAGALVFSTRSARPVRLGAARIALYIDRRQETPARGLAATLIAAAGRSTTITLDPAVDRMTVRVRRRSDGEWTAVWNSTAKLPAAIELRFSSTTASGLHRLLTVPVLVVLEQHQ